MANYNQKNRKTAYQGNDAYPDHEFELENMFGNNEFNYEAENEFELSPGLMPNEELETDSRYGGGSYELRDEFNPGSREAEFEGGGDFSARKDEMEAELEYVTNEDEFSNWVNKVVVRDHRNRNLRPVLNRPIVRTAVKHLSNIASRTLPYLGRRLGGWYGWKRPGVVIPGRYNRHRPGNSRWYGNAASPWGANVYVQQPYGYGQPYAGQQTFNNGSMPQQSADAAADAPQQGQEEQDGSFKNFVIETIRNLSRQIAAGNDSIAALKNSMTDAAVNNFPSIVQPKGAGSSAPPDAASQAASPGEFEFEFEFEDYEHCMPANGELTDNEGGFSEEMEMQLATDLLSVRNEMELDYFLDGLVKKVAGGISGLLGSEQGKILKGILKTVAKKALPIAGAAAGTFFGGPVGGAVGQRLGSAAGNVFGLEMEGMSNEDREFEVARSMVRFGGDATRQVINSPGDRPYEDVRHGIMTAARRFAPGLLRRAGYRGENGYPDAYTNGANQGTWYRQGNRIIIEDI